MADMFDGYVGCRVDHNALRFDGVMTLTHKDGRDPVSHHALHCREQLRLVVNHHVVVRWEIPLYYVKHAFLVQVDAYPAIDSIPQTRALDLARLEYNVPVRQNDRRSQVVQDR